METTTILDTLASKNQRSVLELNNRLADCRTREDLNRILKT